MTEPAFVYVVAFDGDRFVMVRHRDRAWEMPGGRIEPGETPRDAALREFREETGLGVELVAGFPQDGGTVFAGLLAGGEGRPATDEVVEVGRFSRLPGELSFPLVEYREVLAKALAAVESFKRRKGISASALPLIQTISSE